MSEMLSISSGRFSPPTCRQELSGNRRRSEPPRQSMTTRCSVSNASWKNSCRRDTRCRLNRPHPDGSRRRRLASPDYIEYIGKEIRPPGVMNDRGLFFLVFATSTAFPAVIISAMLAHAVRQLLFVAPGTLHKLGRAQLPIGPPRRPVLALDVFFLGPHGS
jgi:hypothetical protein